MTSIEDLAVSSIQHCKIKNQTIRYMGKDASVCAWRFNSLLDKEPETIEWIDSFKAGEVLWDIGANIGIYSIYAALRGIKVVAFEPHFANYFHLCSNIILNGLQNDITAYCLAIAQQKAASTINLGYLDFGTAMSSFDNDLDFRGNLFAPVFRQGMIGYNVDALIAELKFEVPQHIKIDVDGIELNIVKGAKHALADKRLQSVSVELVDTDAAQVNGVTSIMAEAGLSFVHKKQNAAYAIPETKDVMNYLYRRHISPSDLRTF